MNARQPYSWKWMNFRGSSFINHGTLDVLESRTCRLAGGRAIFVQLPQSSAGRRWGRAGGRCSACSTNSSCLPVQKSYKEMKLAFKPG